MVPIASRTLRIVEGAGEREVVVRLFMPEEDDRAWKCAYEIGWPGKTREFRAYGQDAVQAILLAMQIIGAELHARDYHKQGTLVLDEPGAGYGFPVATTLRDLLEGDDKVWFG
jgi:hypothetical protein